MSLIGDTFNLIFFGPIINILVLILHGLQAARIPGALGLAIIAMTILIRLLVWPFMHAQLKSAKQMAELKPHLDALKAKHGKDRQALAAAQMQLYKEHGVNPAGGCLPALIQLPVIIALYRTIYAFFSGTAGLQQINQALYPFTGKLGATPDLHFFGLNLAAKPADFASAGVVVLAIPLITVGLQFIQSKMMAMKPPEINSADTKKEKEEKEELEDSMAAMQSQMIYLMPLMVGYFAFIFPTGLALYWNTFTIMGIIQQYTIAGWGGLDGWISKIRVRER